MLACHFLQEVLRRSQTKKLQRVAVSLFPLRVCIPCPCHTVPGLPQSCKGSTECPCHPPKEMSGIARLHYAERSPSTFDFECSLNHSISMPSPFQGYACTASEEEITAFMSYKKASVCPDDWFEVQNLRYVKNCHSLPMRRCFTPTPPNPTEVGTHRTQYWYSFG